jgi:hypothetical protein
MSDLPEPILWEADEEELLEVCIEELCLEVAENISLQAMSRMCRKGMGYKRHDDARLRNAEYAIDPDQEIGKIVRAMKPIEVGEAHLRPASLWKLQQSLAAAWHEWREKDLRTAHREFDPSGCLGEPWHHEYEAPNYAGLPAHLAKLWCLTLRELWDRKLSQDPPEDPEDLMREMPKELVRDLVEVEAFMEEIRRLDGKYSAVAAFFVSEREVAKEAKATAQKAEKDARREAVESILADFAADRAAAHTRHMKRYRALPAKVRRETEFRLPGQDVCWQCCGPFPADMDKPVYLLAGEEATPLKLPHLEYEVGEMVGYCPQCYYDRRGALEEEGEEGEEGESSFDDDEEDYDDYY